MIFKYLAIGGALTAILIAAGCSDKPTAPDPPSGNGKQAITTINLSGVLTHTDADCFFVTNSANNVMYELKFITVKPPRFKTGVMINVLGQPITATIEDNRCGFSGPAVIVVKLAAQDQVSAQDTSRTIPAK